MKKRELKTGMVVETRDKKRYVVLKGAYLSGRKDDIIIGNNGCNYLFNYTEDLFCINLSDFTIMKIYKSISANLIFLSEGDDCLELIWERKEPPQLTDRERAYLKAYSYDFEWITKDNCGVVYVFKNKPNKNEWRWCSNNTGYDYINAVNMFDFIKWEDEEPYRIKDLLGED